MLFHFEDDDLRTENEKLRQALVSATKNLRKRAQEGRISQEELSGEQPLDFTAVHPLSPRIIQLLKDCSERLRRMQTICTAFQRENEELRRRLHGPGATSSILTQPPSAASAADDEMASPMAKMLVDEIDSAIAASESVAEPVKPGPLPQEPRMTGLMSERPPEVVISRISVGVQTGCSCARKEVALTGSELEFIRTRGEPERSKEWLSTMCTATDRTKAISQKDVWLAYRSQCDGGAAGAAFDPALFFNVLKDLFPAARIAKDGDGKAKEQYMVYGVARKREPCTCGAEL